MICTHVLESTITLASKSLGRAKQDNIIGNIGANCRTVLGRDHVLVSGALELVADVADDDVEAGVAGVNVGDDALGELLAALELGCWLEVVFMMCEGGVSVSLPRRRP